MVLASGGATPFMEILKMNRIEHLQWCKERALAYVNDGDVTGAMASFQSDMGKHEETRTHTALPLMAQLMFSGNLSTAGEVSKFIEDFN